MNNRVMNTYELSMFLQSLFKTDTFIIRKTDRGILVEPIKESLCDKKYSCPFLGTAKGGSLTVDKFIELKQQEKEFENKNEKRLLP